MKLGIWAIIFVLYFFSALYMAYNKTKDFKYMTMATRLFPIVLEHERRYSFFTPPSRNGNTNVIHINNDMDIWEVHLIIET